MRSDNLASEAPSVARVSVEVDAGTRTRRWWTLTEEQDMSQVRTLARWTVIPGNEADFIEAWNQLEVWTITEFPTARGTLLRDQDRSNVFFSFGPWPDAEAVARWRGSAGFERHVGRIRPLLESFEPHTLDLAVSAEGPGAGRAVG
jgi:quinol monooxygenase YgiN